MSNRKRRPLLLVCSKTSGSDDSDSDLETSSVGGGGFSSSSIEECSRSFHHKFQSKSKLKPKLKDEEFIDYLADSQSRLYFSSSSFDDDLDFVYGTKVKSSLSSEPSSASYKDKKKSSKNKKKKKGASASASPNKTLDFDLNLPPELNTRLVIKNLPPSTTKSIFHRMFPDFPLYYKLDIFSGEKLKNSTSSSSKILDENQNVQSSGTCMAYLRAVDAEDAKFFQEEYDGAYVTDKLNNNNEYQVFINFLDAEDKRKNRKNSEEGFESEIDTDIRGKGPTSDIGHSGKPFKTEKDTNANKKGDLKKDDDDDIGIQKSRKGAKATMEKKGEGEGLKSSKKPKRHNHQSSVIQHYYGETGDPKEIAEKIKKARKQIVKEKLNKIFPVELFLLMLMFANSLFTAFLIIMGMAGVGLTRSLHSLAQFGHERPPVSEIVGIHLSTMGLLTCVSALLIVVSTFVGGLGVIIWDKRLLLFFIRVCSGIAILQFIFAGTVFFYSQCNTEAHKQELAQRYELYGTQDDKDSTEVVDLLQFSLQCCGFNDSSTFKNMEERVRPDQEVEIYPASCCNHNWSHNLFCGLGLEGFDDGGNGNGTDEKSNSNGSKNGFQERMNKKGCANEIENLCDMVVKLDGVGLIMWLFAYSINLFVIIIIIVVTLRVIHKIEKKAMAKSKAKDRIMLKHEFEVNRRLLHLVNLRERAVHADKIRIREILEKEGKYISDEELKLHEDIDDTGESDVPSETSEEGFVEPDDPLGRKHIIKLVDPKENANELLEHRGLAQVVRQIRTAYHIESILHMPTFEEEIKQDIQTPKKGEQGPNPAPIRKKEPVYDLYSRWPQQKDIQKERDDLKPKRPGRKTAQQSAKDKGQPSPVPTPLNHETESKKFFQDDQSRKNKKKGADAKNIVQNAPNGPIKKKKKWRY